MIAAARIYDQALRARATGTSAPRVRLSDGTTFPLALDRYLGPADATDQELLRAVEGPVLDVGCGPGRHLHALASRGIFALGVDLSPAAVALAVDGGGRAIVGDVFAEVPRTGSWRCALLLDGNIGIGGSPGRLLGRLAALLQVDGSVLVELGPPGTPTGPTRARLERGGRASAWFWWGRVSADAAERVAAQAGFAVGATWSLGGRWFTWLWR